MYFIRPTENAFEEKYGIVASWDEFGIPSTAKKWVPEPLVKQLIFEKTGNRQTAENILVKSYTLRGREGNTVRGQEGNECTLIGDDGKEVFINAGDTTSKNVMVINVAKILATN